MIATCSKTIAFVASHLYICDCVCEAVNCVVLSCSLEGGGA